MEEVQILLAKTYKASIREGDEKLHSFSAEIELHEDLLNSLRQEFAEVAQKR